MKAGDRIRIQSYMMGFACGTTDYTVEEFRFCLGVFLDEDHRRANKFTPLCVLYERGPESKDDYISHYGSYYTNPVQGWMDIT